MKKCSFCAEEIQDAALVCKHCGRDLKAAAPQAQSVAPKKKTGLGTWVGVGLIIIAGFGWASRLTSPIPSAESPRPTPTQAVPSTNVATPTSPTPTPPAPIPASGGKWTVSQSTSTMDDSKGIVFSLEAANEIEGWLKRQTPTLIVRCKEKSTDVYMVTGMPASVESGDLDGHTVRVRFDDTPAQQQRWSESTDKKAMFAPNARQMARQIAKSKVLRLQFTPFNASPVIATFDVAGFDRHLAGLAAVCGWSPAPTPTGESH